MRINEIRYTDAQPIDGYGPGFFRIGNRVHNGSVLVLPTGIIPWHGYEDVDALIEATEHLDVLFVGTGAEIAHTPAKFRQALEEAGVGVEPMSSPAACRTYNVLLSEGRRIGLALFPV